MTTSTAHNRGPRLDEERRIIPLSLVNMDSFEDGYKAAYSDVLERYRAGDYGLAVEIIFAEDGAFAGHAWEGNCAYSLSDHARNGTYRLSEYALAGGLDDIAEEWPDHAQNCTLGALIEQWEQDVRDEIPAEE